MSYKSNQLNSIIKSRKVLIQMLEYRGYNTSELHLIKDNDLQDLYINNKLDILVDHKNEDKSLLVYYNDNSIGKLGTKILKNILQNISNNSFNNIKLKDNTIDIIILTNDPIESLTVVGPNTGKTK